MITKTLDDRRCFRGGAIVKMSQTREIVVLGRAVEVDPDDVSFTFTPFLMVDENGKRTHSLDRAHDLIRIGYGFCDYSEALTYASGYQACLDENRVSNNGTTWKYKETLDPKIVIIPTTDEKKQILDSLEN